MKKKRNNQMAMWIGLLVFAGIAMAMSLRDQGFFNKNPQAEKIVDDHGHEQQAPTNVATPTNSDDKKASMAAAAAEMKKAGNRPIALDPAAKAPPPPRKPRPNATSTGSQWYRDQAASTTGSN
ncbi:MAG: hypothetical protein JNJ45_00905 [Chthonomonas sp.]|nr:hypothetical protein [Chthonomonas sp.]